MPVLTEPRPSIAAMLAAAGISVEPSGGCWTVLMCGYVVCWVANRDEAETVAHELAMALYAEGLV